MPFRGWLLRIVARLGQGGIGRTFKVEHTDPISGENYGTYVAKVIHTAEAGEAARRAYNRVRSRSIHPGLSTVFDVAERWETDRVMAMFCWLDGESLDQLTGVLSVAAEDYGEESVEALLGRWLRGVCTALALLHGNSLVHGDISPRNLIHHRGDLVLTDYDLVTQSGQAAWAVGTRAYCSPEAELVRLLAGAMDRGTVARRAGSAGASHANFPLRQIPNNAGSQAYPAPSTRRRHRSASWLGRHRFSPPGRRETLCPHRLRA